MTRAQVIKRAREEARKFIDQLTADHQLAFDPKVMEGKAEIIEAVIVDFQERKKGKRRYPLIKVVLDKETGGFLWAEYTPKPSEQHST
jgi:hypothetical protein